MTDRPDNGGETKRQQQTEKRARDGYDDLVERGNFRQSRSVQIRFSFDDIHRRKLRQRHEASERQRSERILNAVDLFFPERFSEPNAEFFHVKSSPARRQKMPQFMHHDEQIKKNKNLEQNEDDAADVK